MALLEKLKGINHRKLYPVIGILLVMIIGLSALIVSRYSRRLEASEVNLYEVTEVKNGSLASSSLLSGEVDASQIETITYDSSKGNLSEIYVYEGQYVNPGDYILSYDQSNNNLEIANAQRALNKAQRELDSYIATGGQVQQEQQYVNSVNYNTQVKNLQDEVANAQANLQKAYNSANQNVLVTEISGKVIEVNPLVDSSKQNPVVVKIASDNLLITGSLTEYDLASIREGQKVEITSKAYPDATWEGRISTISSFPEENVTATDGSSSNTSAKYEFTVAIDGDTSKLRKGFKMTMVIKDNKESQIVPIAAVLTEGQASYVWVYNNQDQTVKKQEVKLGNADATRREVSGLKAGQTVISTLRNSNQPLSILRKSLTQQD